MDKLAAQKTPIPSNHSHKLSKKQLEPEEFTNHPYGIQRLKGLCRFMQSEDWSVRMPEFKEYIKKMDQIRNTDFSSVFPEMKKLLQ